MHSKIDSDVNNQCCILYLISVLQCTCNIMYFLIYIAMLVFSIDNESNTIVEILNIKHKAKINQQQKLRDRNIYLASLFCQSLILIIQLIVICPMYMFDDLYTGQNDRPRIVIWMVKRVQRRGIDIIRR